MSPRTPRRPDVARRRLLQAGGAALASTMLPPWLRAFDLGRPSAFDGATALGRALDRGRALGKPVLAFVIPADEDERWRRGRRLGHWLTAMAGPDDEVSSRSGGLRADPLGLAPCEVACETLAGLRRVVQVTTGPAASSGEAGGEADDASEPWFVLTEPDTPRRPLRGVAIAGPRAEWEPAPPGFPAMIPDSPEEQEAAEERERASGARQIAELDAIVARAMTPDDAALAALASRAAGKLDGAARAGLRAAFEDGAPLDPAVADRAAAIVLERIRLPAPGETLPPPVASAVLASLETGVRARLSLRPPDGARFGRMRPCGSRMEREDGTLESGSRGIGCGLGHVPRLGSRFLRFYTDLS